MFQVDAPGLKTASLETASGGCSLQHHHLGLRRFHWGGVSGGLEGGEGVSGGFGGGGGGFRRFGGGGGRGGRTHQHCDPIKGSTSLTQSADYLESCVPARPGGRGGGERECRGVVGGPQVRDESGDLGHPEGLDPSGAL